MQKAVVPIWHWKSVKYQIDVMIQILTNLERNRTEALQSWNPDLRYSVDMILVQQFHRYLARVKDNDKRDKKNSCNEEGDDHGNADSNVPPALPQADSCEKASGGDKNGGELGEKADYYQTVPLAGPCGGEDADGHEEDDAEVVGNDAWPPGHKHRHTASQL